MSPFDQWLLGALGFLFLVISGLLKWAFGMHYRLESAIRHHAVFIKDNWNPLVEDFRKLKEWKIATFGRNGDHPPGIARHIDK